jgi:hypothetical protein
MDVLTRAVAPTPRSITMAKKPTIPAKANTGGNKEVGIPKNAPAAAKKADDKLDKKKGLKEGSKADLAADKLTMAQFTKKGGKK